VIACFYALISVQVYPQRQDCQGEKISNYSEKKGRVSGSLTYPTSEGLFLFLVHPKYSERVLSISSNNEGKNIPEVSLPGFDKQRHIPS